MPDARRFLGGKWLRKKNISPDEDTIVAIKAVGIDHFEPDADDNDAADEQPERLCLEFEDSFRLLGLNDVNLEQVMELLGDDYDKWAGNRLALYVDSTVKYKGARVGGIRIRPKLPTTAVRKRKRTTKAK